jgi:hypothetical protein
MLYLHIPSRHLGQWRYSSMHSLPQPYMEVKSQGVFFLLFLPWPIHCWGKSATNHCTKCWVNCTAGLDVLNTEKYHSSLVVQARYPLTTFSVNSAVTVQKPHASNIPMPRHSATVTIIISPPPLTHRQLNI